jgi:hypothetical protein
LTATLYFPYSIKSFFERSSFYMSGLVIDSLT